VKVYDPLQDLLVKVVFTLPSINKKDVGASDGMEASKNEKTLLQLACGGLETLPKALSEKEVSECRHKARSVQQLDEGCSNYEILVPPNPHTPTTPPINS
jgi:hypothetical protein